LMVVFARLISKQNNMKVNLGKFGLVLSSRQSGLEARKAFLSRLREMKEDEIIEIDFSEVSSFSPSWADEFLTPLFEEYGARVILQNTENPSVRATLSFLEKIKNKEDLF